MSELGCLSLEHIFRVLEDESGGGQDAVSGKDEASPLLANRLVVVHAQAAAALISVYLKLLCLEKSG